MSSRTSRAGAGAVAALALIIALAGCSDDDDAAASPAPATDAADAGSSDDEGAAGAQRAIADAMGDEEERAFGLDADAMASVMGASTGADRVTHEDRTFWLHFEEGSKEDVSGHINCSAMSMVTGADDTVVIVYPDGELRCNDESE